MFCEKGLCKFSKKITILKRCSSDKIWQFFVIKIIKNWSTASVSFRNSWKIPFHSSLLDKWTVIAWPVFEPVTLWIVGAGTDLNRIWDESSEHVHPTVHGVKQLIDMLSKLVSKFIFLVSFFHLYTEIFYIITQWSCSALGSLWESGDLDPKKFGALLMRRQVSNNKPRWLLKEEYSIRKTSPQILVKFCVG